ncbi:TetR family transcriptional regulator [bacterium]|nr:TetR family transcriptional regulator [bacterium]
MTATRERGRRDAPPRNAAATRERILSAALEAFSRKGVDAVSLDDLAHAALVRKATLLYYFGSKAELYGAVAALVAARFAPLGERLRTATPSADVLGEVVGELHDLFASAPDGGLLFFREAIDGRADGANRAVTPFLDEAERWVRRGQRSGAFSRELAPRQAVDAVTGAVTMFFLNPRLFVREGEPITREAVLAHRAGAIAFVRRALVARPEPKKVRGRKR